MDKNTTKDQLEAFENDFKSLQLNLGLFFQQSRENIGIKSIEDFANTYGYTLSQYRAYESGKANPTLLTIFRLLKILGLNENDLFHFSNNQDRKLGDTVAV